MADATLDNLSVDYNAIVTDGVTKEFLDALQKQKGVEETGNIYMKEINPTFTNEAYALVEKRIFDDPDFQKTFIEMWDDGEQSLDFYREEQQE